MVLWQKNKEKKAILNFEITYKFVIPNTFFKKRKEYLVIFKSVNKVIYPVYYSQE